MRALVLSIAFLTVFAGCTTLPPRTMGYGPAEELARISQPDLAEISGIARSLTQPGVYWVHNDSGDTARIFAINSQGRLLGEVHLAGIAARDCEDIDTFRIGGRNWILLADVGDNDAVRDDLRFQFFPEPDPAELSPERPLTITPAHTWQVAYVDGARDCEGVTVSEETAEILLISKRTEPPVLYTLPFAQGPATTATIHIAHPVTPLPGIEPPTAAERAIPGRLGQFRAQVTAFDLCDGGDCAAVLTYGNIWLYQKRGNEPWTTVFTRPPARIPVTGLPQAEALCFAPDSHDLIVTTERLPAPLQRYPAK